MKRNVLKTYNIIRAALFGAALLFVSCEEKDSKPLGQLNKNFADRTIVDAFLTYKDSGVITMELKSPLIEEFTLIDSPYTIMRKGVNIKFWNSGKPNPNYLRADWAKIIDRKKFYEGKGNVEMINNDGDTLRTQHIFWDNLNRRIFTEDTVTIKRKDGTINIANHGLTASEDFKEFTLFDNHGVIFFDEAGENKTTPRTKPQLPKQEIPEDMVELNPLMESQEKQ
ncbi:LPS export ABC transporter periplasmic protein LptC [Weeksellaceae bacterium KMM 9713]|uniref:LPS export ABC transporter periplasmic protein LptC n=1 Tax=Profundicola chukchiensis TaxID=2961959 RepID=A0A9X4MWX4_9FLAO|nr:LPS export ABC transporter periplasmic protein LptC [Profundicola chukchiensis]MDG4945618.1 LPS export ABC transporter periplasmic protein LptC [Profundicola chukchiensis]